MNWGYLAFTIFNGIIVLVLLRQLDRVLKQRDIELITSTSKAVADRIIERVSNIKQLEDKE